MLFEDAKSKIQVFWGLVVLSCGAILIAIYFFQFESIANWVVSIYPEQINECKLLVTINEKKRRVFNIFFLSFLDLTLSDIGLTYDDTTKDVYLSLLGASGIFFLSVLQFRAFVIQAATQPSKSGYQVIEDKEPNDNENKKDQEANHLEDYDEEDEYLKYQFISDIPIFNDILQLIKRSLVLHAEKITFLLAYAAAIIFVSCLNDILIIFIVLGLVLPKSLNSFGLILVIFCQLITISLYSSEFNGFLSLIQQSLFANDEKLMDSWMEWFGVLVPSDLTLFSATITYNLLIVSLILERYANRWSKEFEPKNGDKCALFQIDRDSLEDTQKQIKLDKDNPFITVNNIRFFARFVLWYLGNFYRKHGIYVSNYSPLKLKTNWFDFFFLL